MNKKILVPVSTTPCEINIKIQDIDKQFNILVVAPKNDTEIDVLLFVLEAIVHIEGINIFVFDVPSTPKGKKVLDFSTQSNNSIHIFEIISEFHQKILLYSDVFIGFSDTSNALLQQFMKYGIVPIIPRTSKFKSYDPVKESGECFMYMSENQWDMLMKIVSSFENHRFPYDWEQLTKRVEKLKF